MLDAFIIEEIKKREREREVEDRPQHSLEVPPRIYPTKNNDEEQVPERGVVIIDYGARRTLDQDYKGSCS